MVRPMVKVLKEQEQASGESTHKRRRTSPSTEGGDLERTRHISRKSQRTNQGISKPSLSNYLGGEETAASLPVVSPGGTSTLSVLSAQETPSTSNSPEQTSDSCASNSPTNSAFAEHEMQPNACIEVKPASTKLENKYSSDKDDCKAAFVRLARGLDHLLPPLLPSPESPAPDAHANGTEIPSPNGVSSRSISSIVCTKETQEKDRVGGLDWGERRRKKMLDKAYSGFEGYPREQQVARLKQTVERLQGALPSDAKAALLATIRRYLLEEVTPEGLAESMKTLVDQHNVVIPLQDLPATSPSSASDTRTKREASTHAGGMPLGKRQRELSRAGRKALRRKEERAKAEVEETSAWEALLSVCTTDLC